jgi:lipoprotein-releasing system ATP-binding protein
MSEPVLTLAGVTKSYTGTGAGRVEVLRGIDLMLRPGECVGLIAPSGAGKSTLLHIAGLLDSADGGAIMIEGQEATRLSEAARTRLRRLRIGFVYQFHHLLPEFSALDNVAMPCRIAARPEAEARARAAELLAEVDLAPRARHRPAELSGGEQQRVAICRALANRPALLLADEPTGNLDPATATLVFDLLLKVLKTQGMAALVATHNPGLAARMDRVVTLTEGRLST